MYLSRLEVNPRRSDARRLLASPQRIHAAVLAGFPESRADATPGRVLWRMDPGQHDSVLYVVSPEKPDLTHLVESVGRPTYGWQTRGYDGFLDRLAVDDRWAFRILANPVHSVRGDDGARGRRLAHVTADQQTAWFLRQADRHGFTIPVGSAGEPDLCLRSRRTVTFERAGRTVTLGTAVFEGTLEITSPNALRAALMEGIGPGKGYGCGLITLAKP